MTVDAIDDHATLFAEGPARAVVAVTDAQFSLVDGRARAAGVPLTRLGVTGGDRFVVGSLVDLAVEALVARWSRQLPDALGV